MKRRAVTLVPVVALTMVACSSEVGVRPVPESEIGVLLDPAPTATATSSTTAMPIAVAKVYFARDKDRLLPIKTDVTTQEPRAALQRVLSLLAEGPSASQSAEGFATLLPNDVQLSVSSIDDGLADISFATASKVPADKLPLVVAQIVLSATTVGKIREVTLQSNGSRLSAPLPDGKRVERPLTKDDYAALIDRQSSTADSSTPAEATSTP